MSRRLTRPESDRGVFDSLPDGIVLLDAQGRVLSINVAAREMLGLGEDALPVPLAQMADRSNADLTELLDLIQAGRKAEILILAADGRQFLAALRLVGNGGGQPVRALVQLRDLAVFDHERGRASTRESRQSFRFLSQQKLRPDLAHQRRISPELNRLLMLGERSMAQNARVLLTGESGVGKTEIARYLHASIGNQVAPFVHVNCGSIPETLFESEMFGYERGAFTGALQSGRKGLIEAADGGTLFLDEVGEIPLGMQAKLLKFLESSTVQRIGGQAEHTVKVRVISATNRDLEAMVRAGEFRRDLFYRLAVVPLTVRPLRESLELFDDLIDFFIAVVNQRRNAALEISKECRARLRQYSFPGNIRELHNIIQQLSVVAEAVAEVRHLPEAIRTFRARSIAPDMVEELLASDLKEQVREFERRLIEKAIAQHGSKRKAAEALGVDIGTIVRKTQVRH
jgi:transcriptional regulator with PAS, ATPase and Fis domain